MLRSLFGSSAAQETKTPFEQADEFKQIHITITSIKQKRDKLEPEGKANGAASLEYIKWQVLDALAKKIDTRIAAYNFNPRHADLNIKLSLIENLLEYVNMTWIHSSGELKKPRNNNKSTVSALTSVGVIGSSIAAGVYVPLTFFGSGVLTYWVSNDVSATVAKKLGLFDDEPDTSRLIKTLRTELKEAVKHIQAVISLDTSMKKYSVDDDENSSDLYMKRI